MRRSGDQAKRSLGETEFRKDGDPEAATARRSVCALIPLISVSPHPRFFGSGHQVFNVFFLAAGNSTLLRIKR
jgi:hypothetical protein